MNQILTPDGEVDSIDRYLIFKLVACRGKQPKFTGFQHRFKENNDMSLVEDANMAYPISVRKIEGVVKQQVADHQIVTKGKRQIVG